MSVGQFLPFFFFFFEKHGFGFFSKMYESISRISKKSIPAFCYVEVHSWQKKHITTEDFKNLVSCVFFLNLKIGGNECHGSLSSVNSAKYHTLFSQRIPYYVQLYRWIDQCRVSCMDFRYVALLTLNSDFVLGKRLYSKKANPQRR